MTRREILLSCLACVVAAGAVIFMVNRNAPVSADARLAKVSPEFLSWYERVRAAEKIADPVKRCLAYPNPPEFHWDPEVVKAVCGLYARKMITWEQIQAALSSHHPEILDKAFASYLARGFGSGEHGYLAWAYETAFGRPSADVLDAAQQWVKEDPGSAFAVMARGEYYITAAWDARGDRFAAQTPPGNFERMHEFVVLAHADFDEALQRNPRMIAAYYELLDVARLTDDSELLANAADKALALDPADDSLYGQWARTMMPKWGGTYADLLAIAQRAKAYESENPLLKRVAARVICAEAESYYISCDQCGSKVYGMALDLYRKAADSTPSGCAIRGLGTLAELADADEASVIDYETQVYRFLGDDEYLLRRALALQKIGKAQWGLESIDHVFASHPRSAEAFNYKGWLFEDEHRYHEAAKAFLAAREIEPSSREATTALVDLYTNWLHEPAKAKAVVDRLVAADPHNPRVWLLRSMLHGSHDEKLCQQYLEKYLQLVDQNYPDSYEQRDIERVKKRLAEIKQILARRKADSAAKAKSGSASI